MTPTPAVLLFDVNETLSDMSPMADRFVEVGAPAAMATTWFASLLRDGFALTAAGDNPRFADVGRAVLRPMLARELRHSEVEGAVEHVLGGFGRLALHPDVEAGVRRLHDAGVRMVTLSNGSTAVAQGLLERAGLLDCVEGLLTVEDAPRWKPAPESYAYALEVCRVAPADAMLVAVHPWDLHGARAAGLRTAWVERGTARYPGHMAAPELTASGIDDLARQLGAAEG
ncbi:haloacid dehalogenase type II [Serinicoccus chungangensis]|uniref:haloacid dehalogenase type II n=1 Tax=Serinicoccus chungangensis TaxID=767452 RepID=UPI00111BA7AB|nr:haloacid dehalogenase type II [Serinicoccus chungangensis]